MRIDTDFKVGDRVVIRDWDAMEDEYGLDSMGDTGVGGCFVRGMRHLCGRELTISKIDNHSLLFEESDQSGGWCFSLDMIRHTWDPDKFICPEINIDILFSEMDV